MNNDGRTEHARGIPIHPRVANNALAFFTSAPPDKDPSSSEDDSVAATVLKLIE